MGVFFKYFTNTNISYRAIGFFFSFYYLRWSVFPFKYIVYSHVRRIVVSFHWHRGAVVFRGRFDKRLLRREYDVPEYREIPSGSSRDSALCSRLPFARRALRLTREQGGIRKTLPVVPTLVRARARTAWRYAGWPVRIMTDGKTVFGCTRRRYWTPERDNLSVIVRNEVQIIRLRSLKTAEKRFSVNNSQNGGSAGRHDVRKTGAVQLDFRFSNLTRTVTTNTRVFRPNGTWSGNFDSRCIIEVWYCICKYSYSYDYYLD